MWKQKWKCGRYVRIMKQAEKVPPRNLEEEAGRQAGSQTSDPVNMGEEWEFSTRSPGAYRSKPSSSKPPKPTFTGVWASPGPSPTGVQVMVLMTR